MSAATPTPLTASPGNTRFDWKRFWIAPTRILDLSDAGFLRDPESYSFSEDALKTLGDLDVYPALALLGEPGIGKSDALKIEHKRLSALENEHNIISVHVDLSDSSSEDRLYKQIFESRRIEAWKAGNSRLYLLLDSLDEALLRIDTVAKLLVNGFCSLPTDRMSVRIACRTAVWPVNTLGTRLKEIWGEKGFGIFELAPLRRRDVLKALSVDNIDPEEFMTRLFGAHAVSFAIKPLTLKMLFRLYKRDGHLPGSTADLYREGCLALCEEQNHSRRETGNRGNLNAPQRLRLAGRIAAATILGHRFAVWTGPETETPTEDTPISALSGAREDDDFPSFTATDNGVREVLDTGLFSSRGDQRMGWAHQTYGEFLAALYIFEKRVPSQTILRALTHPNGGLIPSLAIMGAWVASLNPELRPYLIGTDPWTLLHGDLSNWSGDELSSLVDSMLSHMEQGRYSEFFFGIMETYEKLRHPDLTNQIRTIITNRSLKAITRRRALGIAERCELKELQPELLQSAIDQTEDPMVRAAAIAALRRCGDNSVPAQILAILEVSIGPDPYDEIRGSALDMLWPDHIDANQLFSFLTASNERFVGSYALFFFGLPETLRIQDLSPAIAWATASITAANPIGGFREKTLADAIMFKAWDAFEDPALTDLFLDHIAARLHQFGQLCRGTDFKANEAFSEHLRSDTSRRRQFLLCLFRRPMDRIDAVSYLHAGLVKNDDFGWLLEISPGGLSTGPGLSEESLFNFIRLLFNDENVAQFEVLYPICQRWPLLRERFSFLIDGFPMGSQEAIQAQESYRQLQELQERVPPPAVPDLPAEISRLLARAENGEWQAWWQLNLALMLTPESRGIGDELNYFITSMRGWMDADEPVRQRIVSTAERYLADADTSVNNWLGQQQMHLQHNDLAAMRAFVLLLQAAPDVYKRIPDTTWEKWTPVIVGLPRIGVTDNSPVIGVLLRDALMQASRAFIATVRKILHMEKELARASTEAQVPNVRAPFLILRDLEGCWDNESLKAAMFEEMVAPDIRPSEYAAILDALLKANYEPAIERGLSRIGTLDKSTFAIADIFLCRVPYGGPSCQDRFYDFCKHILEEVISSLRREVLVALSLRRCLV